MTDHSRPPLTPNVLQNDKEDWAAVRRLASELMFGPNGGARSSPDIVERLRDHQVGRSHGSCGDCYATVMDDAADEIERLQTENWQLRQACGYPIPADKETPQNPFKCGTCDARALSECSAGTVTPLDRDKLWHLIARHIACETDCQKWPNGCGCAQNAADEIVSMLGVAQASAGSLTVRQAFANEMARKGYHPQLGATKDALEAFDAAMSVGVAQCACMRGGYPLGNCVECDDPAARNAAQGWQLIDTAPHETSVILGWWHDGVWNTQVGAATHGWRRNGISTMSQHGQATHWMPQPAPPVSSTQRCPSCDLDSYVAGQGCHICDRDVSIPSPHGEAGK